MACPLKLSSSILIVGGGTWGISTALHLARRGYNNVTVLDGFPVPSAISAGNDINKIVELGSISDSEDDESHQSYVSRSLLAAATHGWLHDPVFKPYYHDTGYIVAADSEAAIAQIDVRRKRAQNTDITILTTAEEFRDTMPEGILTGDFPGWQGFFKKTGAGWVHARNAMISATTEAKRLGVNFMTGSPHGTVTGLMYEDGDVVGAHTADRMEHRASRTILCAGANSNQLLDLEDQLRPTAWTLAHIKMTSEEVKLYINLPVLFNVEKGFFMEPDEEKHELKICDEHPGYCNWVRDAGGQLTSLPFARHQIPEEAEQRVRSFLRETMPQLAERPFSFARICWCADTPDRAFLIDCHPRYASLVLGVGGSGHGFKYIPSVGGYIADKMEGQLDEKLANVFRWRPETAMGRDWQDVQGRFGGPNKVMDFQKVQDWTGIGTLQGNSTFLLQVAQYSGSRRNQIQGYQLLAQNCKR